MFKGLYHVYIKSWLRHLSRDQIHVVRTEDYNTDMVAQLREIFQFLDLCESLDIKARVLACLSMPYRPIGTCMLTFIPSLGHSLYFYCFNQACSLSFPTLKSTRVPFVNQTLLSYSMCSCLDHIHCII